MCPRQIFCLRRCDDALRVVVNREKVGEEIGLGDSERDVFMLGDCDAQLLGLAEELGWLFDLAKYVNDMCEASGKLLRSSCDRE